MVLKTFNVSEEAYNKFSKYCKEYGISMSKQIDLFMRAQMEEEPVVKKEYLEKLERIRKEKTIHVGTIEDFDRKYGIKKEDV